METIDLKRENERLHGLYYELLNRHDDLMEDYQRLSQMYGIQQSLLEIYDIRPLTLDEFLKYEHLLCRSHSCG